jgi:hypothetical protein
MERLEKSEKPPTRSGEAPGAPPRILQANKRARRKRNDQSVQTPYRANFREFPLCEVGVISRPQWVINRGSEVYRVLPKVPNSRIASMAEYFPDSCRIMIVVHADELRILR